VPTHFIRRLNMREQLIREVEIIPLEVVVQRRSRSCRSGSASRKARKLPRSIIEFYYKNDQLNDPMVSEEHITAFAAGRRRRRSTTSCARHPRQRLPSGLFLGVGIRLVDFKMETGRLWKRHDGIRSLPTRFLRTPAGCGTSSRTRSSTSDRFRRDLGGLLEALPKSPNGSAS
jgi:phosphoribosylaminoimidazole-succinocarboxamide synthase